MIHEEVISERVELITIVVSSPHQPPYVPTSKPRKKKREKKDKKSSRRASDCLFTQRSPKWLKVAAIE